MRTELHRRAAGRRRTRLALALATTTIASAAGGLAAQGTAAAEPRPIHELAAPTDAPEATSDVPFDDAFIDDDRTGPVAATTALDACPVAGPHEFEDSWGWARSGGRTHQGVDLIAERGTPVVAVRDGRIEHTQSARGGRSAWLLADDGLRFYYAHLDEWIGPEREVEAGDVIGTVGSTGNARGSHLHFEIRPGDEAINPYAHAVQSCGDPTVEAPTTTSSIIGDRLTRPV